jgi:hypothetical protein
MGKWGKFLFLKALIVITNVAVKCIRALKVIKMRGAIRGIIFLKTPCEKWLHDIFG